MNNDQIGQLITQLGLSAVFLFMLWKLWTRHMQMTDRIIAILEKELDAARAAKAEDKPERD